MTFLDEMAASSRERLTQARAQRPLAALQSDLAAAPPLRPLAKTPFLLIAELKRTSPALGRLVEQDSPIAPRIRAYTDGGAAAISILTEPTRFNGSLDDLKQAAVATHLPVMRKDFLIDPYQVTEARIAGASGVLLIVRILSDQQLADMLAAATDLNMFTLIEVFDQHDAQRATHATSDNSTNAVIGVNTRDLATLTVHPERLFGLRKSLPHHLPVIAESGLQTPDDVAQAAQWGYQGALIGGALMRAPDPAQLCRDMIRAGTAARKQA